MSLENLFIYFEHYDARVLNVFACQGNEPTEADVAAFEQRVGFRLPEEFRTFTKSPLGGLYVEVKEQLWPRPKANDAGAFWTFLFGLKVFGISTNVPPWLDLRTQYEAFCEKGAGGLVPFFQFVTDPRAYCFDSAGRIIAWTPDDPDERRVIPMTFSDLLMRELLELEERQAMKRAQQR
ncbi:MAG TPA: SMI1/KNR4 family protein [Tepidisphaeraceae bacterium]|nr:SMI1/KNR4 family protein [Tepidisphaeraceae bacterium]